MTRNFNASASKDINKLPLTYKWDFGDGTSGFGKKASHKYDTYGIKYAKLTVTNSHGATTDSELVKIIVAKCADIQPPPTGDGTVAISDIGAVVAAFGSVPGADNWNEGADLNNDGSVNIGDIGLVVAQFGMSCTV